MVRHLFTATPRDLLFLRDARPMEASDAGLGANWPRPDQLWNALINAFHRQWPERQDWEGAAHTRRDDENPASSCRFGALKTIGPFPCKSLAPGGVEVYYPIPLDWNQDLVPCRGTNLPVPLTHAFRARRLGKATLPEWVSATDHAAYLAGRETLPALEDPQLYASDRNIGIAIDAATGSTVEGRLYQAEYLRLAEEVRLVFTAACNLQPKDGATCVDLFARPDAPHAILLGGQQGLVGLKTPDTGVPLLPPLPAITTRRVRWTLLSPAVFPAIDAHSGGWLPSWVDGTTGTVLLPQGDTARHRGEDRKAWRKRVKAMPAFSAKLIAARIGKPLVFSGWDLQAGGPKPTQLAVPAGACYVFDCATVEEARALSAALHGRPRSSTLGEKGFGLGVCSSLPNPAIQCGLCPHPSPRPSPSGRG